MKPGECYGGLTLRVRRGMESRRISRFKAEFLPVEIAHERGQTRQVFMLSIMSSNTPFTPEKHD